MSCHCNCEKTVYSGSSNALQAVPVNGLLAFNKNIASDVTYTSNSVTVRRPGIYLVNVSASGALTGATAGNIVLQLQRNGQNLDGAYQATANSTAADDIENISLTALVRVDPTECCLNDKSATISIASTGVGATFTNVMITIVRV